VTVVFLTSGTSYTRPADWSNLVNTVECFGGGANGTAGLFCGCFGIVVGGFTLCWFAKDKILVAVNGTEAFVRALEAKAAALKAAL
jgi:hypothetical protein